MKKPIILMLLTIYMAVQLKPLTLVLADVMAHAFWKAHHLATKHHDHHHQHLHEEIEEDNHDDHDHLPINNTQQNKVKEDLSEQYLTNFILAFNNKSLFILHKSTYHYHWRDGFTEIIIPPPKG